jgi:hypothetical protein
MSKIAPEAFDSPLPNTIEDAREEILKLRSILIREREQHVKLVERHELDGRSMRGLVKMLREELNSLRTVKP